MPNPNGAVAGNSQNIPDAHTPRTRSTFPLHAHLFNTHRFGEYIPHYVEDVVKGDVLPIHSSHDLRSYTLESPLMQNVKRNKDYFLVPMESILPLNWEKFFDNPVRGDDVLDDVGPSVENFWSKVSSFMQALHSSLITILGDSSNSDSLVLQAIFRFLVFGEYFYSNGNLLSSLGCHGAPYCRIFQSIVRRSWDYFFDSVVTQIVGWTNSSFDLSVDGYTYQVVKDPKVSPGSYVISYRHAIQLMRDNPTFTISNFGGSGLRAGLNNHISGFSFTFVAGNVPCNLSKLWAYQLCCAHYFSNDHIDFVYSAELFRQLIGNYIYTPGTQWSQLTPASQRFNRNGVSYLYDYLSAHFCTAFLAVGASSAVSPVLLTDTNTSRIKAVQGYFSALFGYRRSLRYLDYFTGSRAQPLAVVNAGGYSSGGNGVTSPSLSVLDITRSIQVQRFLNSVNRVRHQFEGYLKGIFGGETPAPDYHNPFYLAHTVDTIFGQETENTASEQLGANALPIAITTNLRSSSSKYAFEVRADRPCIAIGITSYDITRVYAKSIDRSFLHLNRFDWFNPFMQYIGDQPVYIQELGISPTSSTLVNLGNFAYQIRHSEYKQHFNKCAGGFVENLPGWIFKSSDERGDQLSINPDWIRSLNSEFDQFYVKLTGYSLGSYFHFIVDDFNSVNASRPMAFAPQILG